MTTFNLSPQEFSYRFPQKVFGHVPGSHSGRAMGSGDRFAGFADLFDFPDPRRLDVRASLRNQFAGGPGQERWLVRRYQQRASITLWLLADLSRSMSMGQGNNQQIAKLAHMIAHSAINIGDRFAMAGFDASWRQDVTVMPTRQRSMPSLAAAQVFHAAPTKQPGLSGLLRASELITSPRALVFLASDFCGDLSVIERTLRQLAHYTVVPIVWQHEAVDYFPSHAGWTEVNDAETGQRRSVWVRPTIKKRWEQQMQTHFEQLNACFMRYQFRPLYVQGELTAQQLTDYFYTLKKS